MRPMRVLALLFTTSCEVRYSGYMAADIASALGLDAVGLADSGSHGWVDE